LSLNELSRQSTAALEQAATDLLRSLPTLLGALALLLAGWLLASLLRHLSRRLA